MTDQPVPGPRDLSNTVVYKITFTAPGEDDLVSLHRTRTELAALAMAMDFLQLYRWSDNPGSKIVIEVL